MIDKEVQEFRDWARTGGFRFDYSLFYDVEYDDYEKWTEEMCDKYVMEDRLLVHKNPYIRWRENYKYDYIIKQINPKEGDNILDAGTGSGVTLDRIKKGNLYGFDLSQRSVDFVNKKLKNKKGFKGVVKAWADNLPYEDEFFDSIVCEEIIEHVRNPMRVLAELKRVLKPGGVMIITTPSKLLNIMKTFVHTIGMSWVLGDSVPLRIQAHIHEFNMKGLKDLLWSRKLDIISKGYFPFKIIGETIMLKVTPRIIKYSNEEKRMLGKVEEDEKC